MRYFKLKKVVNDFTTLSLLTNSDETAIIYAEENGYEIAGVETNDSDFVSKQHIECEVEELTFSDVKLILSECKMMKDLDDIIEAKIAEKYTLGKEFKMRDLPEYDAQRMLYEDFKQAIKDEISAKKRALGLIE